MQATKRCFLNAWRIARWKVKPNKKVVTFNADEYELAYYDKEQNERAIHNGDITLAREEGFTEGSKERSIQIAKNLLTKNISIEIISEATGLSLEEIEKIKQ